MDFSETVVVYDVKVGRCSKLNQYMNLYEYQRSRSFIDLHPRSLRSTFSNFFSLETFRPVKAKFHVEPPWDRGMNVYTNGLCHMTNVAAMPIYDKNLKKSSSLEPKGQWPWKLVCSIRYSNTPTFDPELTLTYFTARSNLIPYAFVWEKGKITDFSETIVVYDYCSLWGIKVHSYSTFSIFFWQIQPTKWVHEPLWISKVKVIHWTSSKVIHIQPFSIFFCSETARPIEAKYIWFFIGILRISACKR